MEQAAVPLGLRNIEGLNQTAARISDKEDTEVKSRTATAEQNQIDGPLFKEPEKKSKQSTNKLYSLPPTIQKSHSLPETKKNPSTNDEKEKDSEGTPGNVPETSKSNDTSLRRFF